MPRIERFEDTESWQKARELAAAVYQATAKGAFARDLGLRDQIRRAAVSVMSNIAEGFERNGDNEFRHFLSMAKGSVGEVRAQLDVALDTGLVDRDTFAALYTLADETARLIGGFIRYLGRQRQQQARGGEDS